MVGMEEWQALPAGFYDAPLASELDGDRQWVCWINMFPSIAQPGKHCTVELGIKYNHNTGMFVKTYQPISIE